MSNEELGDKIIDFIYDSPEHESCPSDVVEKFIVFGEELVSETIMQMLVGHFIGLSTKLKLRAWRK
jgi:hypothetical protein